MRCMGGVYGQVTGMRLLTGASKGKHGDRAVAFSPSSGVAFPWEGGGGWWKSTRLLPGSWYISYIQ